MSSQVLSGIITVLAVSFMPCYASWLIWHELGTLRNIKPVED